jgi:hypothetical protein
MSFLLAKKRGCDTARRRVKCNQENHKRNVIEKTFLPVPKEQKIIAQKFECEVKTKSYERIYEETKNSLPA